MLSTPIEPKEIPAHGDFDDEATLEKLKGLSKVTGVMLVTAGIAGIILPVILGTPLLVAGGLVLAPRTFGRLDASLKRRFPEIRRSGMRAVGRFLEDLEKRYPST